MAANNDVVISENTQSTGIQDQLIKAPDGNTQKGTESAEQKFRRQTYAAVIASEINESPFSAEITKFIQPENMADTAISGLSSLNMAAEQSIQQRNRATLELFMGANQDAQAVSDAFQIVQEEEEQKLADPDKGVTEFVEAVRGPGADQELVRDLETRLKLLDQLMPIVEDIDGWEIAKDVALEMLITPKALFDNWQLTGEGLDAHDTVRKTIDWFHGLSPEDKEAYFPQLQEMALEAMPRHRAVTFLQALLDPTAAQTSLDEFGLWAAIDAAAVGAGIAALALRLRKALNPLKAAATAGDFERAADMNVMILQSKDDDLAATLGVDRLTATSNAQPFLLTGTVDDGVASSLSPAVNERIFQFRDRIKEVFGDFSEGNTFIREGILQPEDIPRATARINDEFNNLMRDRFGEEADKIVNITSKSRDERGITFEFEIATPGGAVIKDTYRGKFLFDDVGQYTTLPRESKIFSEKTQSAKTSFIDTTLGALRLDLASQSVAKQLKDLTKIASDPIRKATKNPIRRSRKLDELDSVLLAGDDLDVEFTPLQLREGINGIKLSDDQIEAYYNYRGLMNGLGILRNMEARAVMEAQGIKELAVGSFRAFGKPLERAFDADSAIRNSGAQMVWRLDGGGGPVSVRDLDLAKEYNDGMKLIRLSDDKLIDGQRFNLVLAKSRAIHDLPSLVLDLKKGYIPRLNKNALYFVQAFPASSLNGVQSTTRKALRSFDNKKEADAFAAAVEASPEAHGLVAGTKVRVNADGELEAFKAGSSGLSGVHGLIYSPRSKKPIPHNDGDASTVPRTSALESIELYLDNTKDYLTRNEWRMGVQKRWENAARFQFPGDKDISFDEPGKALSNSALATAHQKIQEFSGFASKSERYWENTLRDVHEWSIAAFGRHERINDFLLNQANRDPIAWMRSVTFHSLLGFFNPVQLWVQAQGAAVAVSIGLSNPATLAKNFRKMHVMTLLEHMPDDILTNNQARKLAKIGGFKDADEVRAVMKAWRQTGLHDSVLSSADVDAAARGFMTTSKAFKRFADSGLLFFRAGELFNRRTAFLTAMEEMGGISKVAGNSDQMKKLLDRANDLILNLGKSNRAAWQKGPLSIPFQFLQIQAKTIESVLGMNGALKGADRIRLFAGQAALYGTAGMFLGTNAARMMATSFGWDQRDLEDMHPGWIKAVNGGLTDWMAYMLGADVSAAERGALFNGMDQTLLSLFTEEKSFYEYIGGPSSVLGTRLARSIGELSVWFGTPMRRDGRTDLEASDVMDWAQRLVSPTSKVLLSPFASANQYAKFRLMQDLGVIRDNNGNLIAAPREGFNLQTEIATLIGFKPDLLQRKFDLSDILQAERDYVELRVNMMVKGFDEFLIAMETARVENRNLSDEELKRFRKDRELFVAGLDPSVRQKVLERFRRRVSGRLNKDNQHDRLMRRYWENMVFRVTDDLLTDGNLVEDGARLIQTLPDREETE